jgi:PLP dependent protein
LARGAATVDADIAGVRLRAVEHAMDRACAAAGRTRAGVKLLAVSKTQSALAIRALHAAGQTAFGENYVQEALGKQRELGDLALRWHLIGPLQSNKAKLAANAFDCIESVDRPKLIDALAAAREPGREPLEVLIQVNVDGETSKSGCTPEDVRALAVQIAERPTLKWRGLMSIPDPNRDLAAAHRRCRALFDALLAEGHPLDTLSIGMSGDLTEAIAAGSTQIRVGTALFGARG